jgi:hypothetical protein
LARLVRVPGMAAGIWACRPAGQGRALVAAESERSPGAMRGVEGTPRLSVFPQWQKHLVGVRGFHVVSVTRRTCVKLDSTTRMVVEGIAQRRVDVLLASAEQPRRPALAQPRPHASMSVSPSLLRRQSMGVGCSTVGVSVGEAFLASGWAFDWVRPCSHLDNTGTMSPSA